MPTMRKLKSNSKTSLHRNSSIGSNTSTTSINTTNNNIGINNTNNNEFTNHKNSTQYFDISKELEREKFVHQQWQQERLRQEVSCVTRSKMVRNNNLYR